MATDTKLGETKQAGEGGADKVEKPKPETPAQAASRQARVMTAKASDPEYASKWPHPGQAYFAAAWAHQRAAELNAGTTVGEEHARIAAELFATIPEGPSPSAYPWRTELDAKIITADAMVDHADTTEDPHDNAAASDAAWRVESHFDPDDRMHDLALEFHFLHREYRLAAGSARVPRFANARRER